MLSEAAEHWSARKVLDREAKLRLLPQPPLTVCEQPIISFVSMLEVPLNPAGIVPVLVDNEAGQPRGPELHSRVHRRL